MIIKYCLFLKIKNVCFARIETDFQELWVAGGRDTFQGIAPLTALSPWWECGTR